MFYAITGAGDDYDRSDQLTGIMLVAPIVDGFDTCYRVPFTTNLLKKQAPPGLGRMPK